jgi:hypothetical protein
VKIVRRTSLQTFLLGVVPGTVGDEQVGLLGPPGARFVGVSAVVSGEDGIDDRPGGLNRVLAGEERAVTAMASPRSRSYGASQQALNLGLLTRRQLEQEAARQGKTRVLRTLLPER